MINEIKMMMEKSATSKEQEFVKHLGQSLLGWIKLEDELKDDFFEVNDFETLRQHNQEVFQELIGDRYLSSYANPDFAAAEFGQEKGQFVAALYHDFLNAIQCAYEHDTERLEGYMSLYLALGEQFEASLDTLKKIYQEYKIDTMEKDVARQITTIANPSQSFAAQVMEHVDVSDLRYLFKFGVYITDNEIKTAEFLMNYDEDALKNLMKMTARAYVNGFKTDGKDVSLRDNVQIKFNVGQERMIKCLIDAFADEKLTGFFGGILSTPVNKQYQYDHRFDNGVYLDEFYADQRIKAVTEQLEVLKEYTLNYSGIMYFDKFGETPFEPASKKTSIQYTDDQNKVSQKMQVEQRNVWNDYFKGSETSFCIIAFPVPEIGEQFSEIFEDTCKINQLTSEEYLPIQQSIIDALDKAEYVHVKGVKGNETDIKVMHNPLANPDKETNYCNCGADVNIPVGEVFTSPVLKGTNGTLDLDVVYLDELKYIDLKLHFVDGYVKDYSCGNFETEEENRKFVEENLLFPHKTLPLGEFAIGTNTLAYVIAEKYDMVDMLPVLIVEKMGPHFAVGDTCFTYAEDIDVYNPDGKCIVARDNEKSILRKEDMSKAYTNVHTDITLPYDSIETIAGVTGDGQVIDIIKHGRFVLKGTEKLNEPFENAK